MPTFIIEYKDAEQRALMKEIEAASREEAWARAGYWLEAADAGRTQVVSIFRKPATSLPGHVRDTPTFIFNTEIILIDDPAEGRKLDSIINALSSIAVKVNKAMALIDDVQAGVAANTDAIESAITLLGNLKSLLDAAGTDPVKLQAIKDTLASEDAKLAAAVVANTPAAPTT